ncbi:hypothetical protein CP49_03685 [Bradyrhizobium valentinum]|uniref:Uncharacterized protein n=1 Tax=Bradyrhizobium valentinum TaxID=1518501 RepID=A0A0R3LCJ3_9BRAD|nr:hypothetical protein CP49_03685 [Bradyrhizobium valentinum]
MTAKLSQLRRTYFSSIDNKRIEIRVSGSPQQTCDRRLGSFDRRLDRSNDLWIRIERMTARM